MTRISVAQTPEMYFLPEYLDGTRVQLSLNLPAVQTITSIFRDDGTHTFGFYVAGNWSGAVHPSDRFIIFADTHVYHDTNPIQYTQHRPKIRDNLYAGYHYIDPAVGFVLTTTPVNASYGIVEVSNSIKGWNHCGYYATGFRMYDPSVGRYLAPDLAGAPFWNSYHYANNNPLVYTDPSGLAAISGTAIAIGLIWAALSVGAGEGIAKLEQGENYEPSGWRMAGNGVASVIPGLGVARAAHKGWKGARLAVAAFGWGYAGEIAGQTVANKGEVSKVSWTGDIADTAMNLALGQAAEGIVRGVKHAGKLARGARSGIRGSRPRIQVRSPSGNKDVRPAKFIRELPRGSANGVVDEAAYRTFQTNLEYGVIRLQNGKRYLVSGGTDGIDLPINTKRIIFHSHPNGHSPNPSDGDVRSLIKTGQRKSYIRGGGKFAPFWRKGLEPGGR